MEKEESQRGAMRSLSSLPFEDIKEVGEMCEISKSKVIVEEDSHQNIEKTLEDEFNDFFSNPASPRLLLGPRGESM